LLRVVTSGNFLIERNQVRLNFASPERIIQMRRISLVAVLSAASFGVLPVAASQPAGPGTAVSNPSGTNTVPPGQSVRLTIQPKPLTDREKMDLAVAKQRTATSITAGESQFVYVPGCRWIEKVNGVQVRTYREQGRQWNASTVRLKSEETNGYLTFDFFRNRLNYNGTSINADITAIGSEINEFNVTGAEFPGGTLRMQTCSTKKWTERGTNSGAKPNSFDEAGRGAGGVGMIDWNRNVQLQITPISNSIHYSSASEPNPRLIYTTTRLMAVQFYNFGVVH
jgi:hypothetical protein